MKIKTLSIDLETYSDIDLKKSGVYPYAESPEFEILLFAYSVNEGPVEVIDLACGEEIPEEILDALTDNTVEKWAYNCSFERVCLSYWLKKNHPDKFVTYSIPEDSVSNYLDPSSWKCSRIWGAYMGLPLFCHNNLLSWPQNLEGRTMTNQFLYGPLTKNERTKPRVPLLQSITQTSWSSK